MAIVVRVGSPDDTNIVAEMVGDLLNEIMRTVGVQYFSFDLAQTQSRTRQFIERGIYSVLIASDSTSNCDVGIATLYESHALYAEGAFGTIPEFYVRPEYRSQQVGHTLLDAAKTLGRSRGWTRLEVTTPPVPAFDRSLTFYEKNGFGITGGRKLKLLL